MFETSTNKPQLSWFLNDILEYNRVYYRGKIVLYLSKFNALQSNKIVVISIQVGLTLNKHTNSVPCNFYVVTLSIKEIIGWVFSHWF